ncbi:MAG: 5'/3'-nucleotidase SurE [Acidobacteriota bacterium]
MRTTTIGLMIVSMLVPVLALAQAGIEQNTLAPWPARVLITNDDGIDNPRLHALARGFAKVAETTVVAPVDNRSGSSTIFSVLGRTTIKVQQRSIGDGIRAWSVDGYPADCVLLALKGFLKDRPPDLVVSGINDGSNMGFDWVLSGTVGAARVAALAGVPSIAVSGLNEKIPGSLEAVADFTVRLARSKIVRSLGPAQYLTVSVPTIPPTEIRGVRVARRAGLPVGLSFDRSPAEDSTSGQEAWKPGRPRSSDPLQPDTDAALDRQGYVVIVPMRADEVDSDLLRQLNADTAALPAWQSGRASAAGDRSGH